MTQPAPHTPDNQPGITLEPRRVICARHGEPFRINWPAGYIPFMLHALERVLQQEGFSAYAGNQVENIDALLDQRPLCCRMSPDDRLEAYARSGIGTRGFCRVCRQPTNVCTIRIGENALPHAVCFLCLEQLQTRGRRP